MKRTIPQAVQPTETDAKTKALYTINRKRERTCFQSGSPYSPVTDIRTDIAIAYGINDSLSSRIAEWKRHGYVPHVMTGAAWGGYADYIEGRFDGKPHRDEGQVNSSGTMIMHDPKVPYMVPTPSYQAYLISLARQAIDAGAEALHFEEPEFWSAAGYSEGFKRLWKDEYDEAWQRPDSSPDAYWRAARLKYLLYKRTLERVCTAAKQHAQGRGRKVGCYVPTHSLINYAQWGIVSPESGLMDLPNCDGYIAQVWTGTARSPNYHDGVSRERTFETAYLEYASMHSMVAPTGRKVFFLADPVEDDPNHTWDDYRRNYERVVAASLLFPDVSSFEVMPWPERVMGGKYPAGSYARDAQARITLPPSYGVELMTVINALNDMKQPSTRWECGSRGIAVLASDTMMFQREGPWSSDGALGGFFGLAMPLLKRGLPLSCVILERVRDPRAFEGVEALLMSYEHMKPMRPEFNEALAKWVEEGGVLLYFGDDADPFHKVREWWNAGDARFANPREELFHRMGLPKGTAPGVFKVGDGWVCYRAERPDQLARSKDGASVVVGALDDVFDKMGKGLQMTNHLVLHRGPYVVGGVMDESESVEPLRLNGTYADLFTSGMRILTDPVFPPGEVFLMRRLGNGDRAGVAPVVLGGSARVEKVDAVSTGTFKISAHGPESVPEGILRIRLAAKPSRVEVIQRPGEVAWEWSEQTRTVLLRFRNRPKGTDIVIEY